MYNSESLLSELVWENIKGVKKIVISGLDLKGLAWQKDG